MIRFLTIIFIYVWVIPTAAYAQDCLVPAEVYREATQYILSGKYDDAEKIVDRFISENSGEPAGPLLKAAVLQYACSDYEDFSREDEFLRFTDQTEQLARKKLGLNGDDLWARYFLSASESLRGVWTVTSGKFIRGIIKGRSGAKGMEEIVSQDSTFYDAYVVLGSYHFWRSVALDSFSWFPFVDGNRIDGLKEVETGLSRGKLTSPLSSVVLLEMLLKHNPAQAVQLGERMVGEYPSCRLFAWQLGEAYKILKRYDDAVRVFTRIADSMAHDENDDGSGELRCWWKLAVLSKSVGKTEECMYYCNKVIELGNRESVYRRQKERISKARHIIDAK